MFDDIIGQDRVKEFLKGSIEKAKVSHSYIFSGPQGTQKEEMAKSLAEILFCEGKIKPCEKCVPCNKLKENNHPDFIEIFPDGAHVKIKQIRRLRKDITIKPYESSHKVYLIYGADTMRSEAQNALLKTLEEPPSYGIIILLAENIQNLLPTIISRSQNLKFNPVDVKSIEKHLVEKEGIEENRAKEIAIASNGRIKIALDLLKQEDLFQEKQELIKYLLQIIKGDVHSVFMAAKWLIKRKDSLDQWYEFLIIWFRDIILFRELGENPLIFHREYKDEIKNFLYYLSDIQLHAIIEEIYKSQDNLRANVNVQLNIETMLLKMQEE